MADEKPIKLPDDFKGVLRDLLNTPRPQPAKKPKGKGKSAGKKKRR